MYSKIAIPLRTTDLAHQAAYAAKTDVEANVFQLFWHARATKTSHAETRLFFDMRQCDQIGPLSATGRTTAENAIRAR